MVSDTTTTVIQVPSGRSIPSTTLKALCQRFRKARLSALQADPAAFSSSYERESQFDDEAWTQRLQNPVAKSFVALAINSNVSLEKSKDYQANNNENVAESDHIDNVLELLCDNDWVGMIILLGPKALAADSSESPAPWKIFLAMGSSATLDTSSLIGREAAYFATSMFVLPEARKKGIGRRLIAASFEAARNEAAAIGASEVNVCLIAEANNTPAIQLYRSCGFGLLPRHPELDTLGQNKQPAVAMAKKIELRAHGISKSVSE